LVAGVQAALFGSTGPVPVLGGDKGVQNKGYMQGLGWGNSNDFTM